MTSSETLLEACRVAQRINEYDATISIWRRKAQLAAEMIATTEKAKAGYLAAHPAPVPTSGHHA